MTDTRAEDTAQHTSRWGPPVAGRDGTGVNGHSRKHWGLGDVIAWLAIGIGVSVLVTVVGAVLVIAPALRGNPTDPATVIQDKLNDLTTDGPFLLASLIALWIGFLGGPLYATRRKGAKSLAKDFGLYFKKVDLLWGPALGLVMLGLSSGVSALMNLIGFKASDNVGEITGVHNKGWLVLLVVLGTFVAPVFEELFFRGLFQRSLLNRLAKPKVGHDVTVPNRRGTVISVLISSAVFGLLHTTSINQGGASVAVQTGLLGVVLGVSAVKFRRLGPGIGAHLTNNGIALLIALI